MWVVPPRWWKISSKTSQNATYWCLNDTSYVLIAFWWCVER
jgi:hypothetical protein